MKLETIAKNLASEFITEYELDDILEIEYLNELIDNKPTEAYHEFGQLEKYVTDEELSGLFDNVLDAIYECVLCSED